MTREELLEKTVIGSLKVYNKNKELVEDVEILGQIMAIDDEHGILVCNHDTKKSLGLPIILNAFRPAKEGYYTLNSGAKIKNPDLICNMVLQEKQN